MQDNQLWRKMGLLGIIQYYLVFDVEAPLIDTIFIEKVWPIFFDLPLMVEWLSNWEREMVNFVWFNDLCKCAYAQVHPMPPVHTIIYSIWRIKKSIK